MATHFQLHSHRLVITIDSPVFEAADAARLEGELLPYAQETIESVDLDLSRVEQIDSEAICTLVSLHHRLAQPTTPFFSLSNPRPEVRRVFQLLGINRIFESDDSLTQMTPLAS